MALALYTGQRRSDLVLLGRQHMTVHNGSDWLRFTQLKNKRNKPVHMETPIAPELRVVMDATPMGDIAFLTNGYGRAFTSNGFGNKFRDWCDARVYRSAQHMGYARPLLHGRLNSVAPSRKLCRSPVTRHRKRSPAIRYQPTKKCGLNGPSIR